MTTGYPECPQLVDEQQAQLHMMQELDLEDQEEVNAALPDGCTFNKTTLTLYTLIRAPPAALSWERRLLSTDVRDQRKGLVSTLQRRSNLPPTAVGNSDAA